MRKKGEFYESEAAAWLHAKGLCILARNFTRKTGEIDIVALDDGCLVFLEVRARSNRRFVTALASVDQRKQLRILRTAQLFLRSHKQWENYPCRFDVIAFEPQLCSATGNLRWIKGAFTA